jgi:hypothetical protein
MTRLSPHQLVMVGMCRSLPHGVAGHMSPVYAHAVLVEVSGLDYGLDCKQWQKWAEQNKESFARNLNKAWRHVRRLFPYWKYLEYMNPEYQHRQVRARKAKHVLQSFSGEDFDDYVSWERWVLENRGVFLDRKQCYGILRNIEIERYPYDLLYENMHRQVERDDPGFLLFMDVGMVLENVVGDDF